MLRSFLIIWLAIFLGLGTFWAGMEYVAMHFILKVC